MELWFHRVSVVFYFLSFLFFLLFQSKRRNFLTLSTIFFSIALVTHAILLVIRGFRAGHLPYQSLYESLVWFTWNVGAVYLIFEGVTKSKKARPFLLALILIFLLYALLGPHKRVSPLFPALQSYWFYIHVSGAFVGYAIFFLAFVLEILIILKKPLVSSNPGEALDLQDMRNFVYKLILFAFPLLTLCIFTGAAWANDAWGRYWGWDPKETWSLITWFTYAAYLHARVTPKLSRGFASFLNILGFIFIVMTFIGVNYITRIFRIESLHAY